MSIHCSITLIPCDSISPYELRVKMALKHGIWSKRAVIPRPECWRCPESLLLEVLWGDSLVFNNIYRKKEYWCWIMMKDESWRVGGRAAFIVSQTYICFSMIFCRILSFPGFSVWLPFVSLELWKSSMLWCPNVLDCDTTAYVSSFANVAWQLIS